MTFPTLDDAESALDWIGVSFFEADDAFEGTVTPEDRGVLASALEDADTPAPVRALAAALGRLLDGARDDDATRWRVAFES